MKFVMLSFFSLYSLIIVQGEFSLKKKVKEGNQKQSEIFEPTNNKTAFEKVRIKRKFDYALLIKRKFITFTYKKINICL